MSAEIQERQGCGGRDPQAPVKNLRASRVEKGEQECAASKTASPKGRPAQMVTRATAGLPRTPVEVGPVALPVVAEQLPVKPILPSHSACSYEAL